MNTHKRAARTFGIFFIIAFLSYGIGSGMLASVAEASDFLSVIHENNTTLIVAVILIALIHSFVNIGLPVVMLPILKKFNKTLTYGYLSAGVAATTIAVVGTIFSLLLIPLSAEYAQAGSAVSPHFETVGNLLVRAGGYSYQISMALWGLGGLLFVSVLYISKLVPQFISIWGAVGYVIFIAGTILELFGLKVGVLLSLPGGLFEICLSLWLIFKGFKPPALESVST